MSQEEINRKLEEQKRQEEKAFNEAIKKINLEQAETKDKIDNQLNYLAEVRKKIETNEPITEEDITNVTAIFEGKSVSLNRQEQNLTNKSSQIHK